MLLIGWDFDTRIHLTRGRRWWQKAWKRQYPSRLGDFIPWLTRHCRSLEVRVLKWGIGSLELVTRGSMMLDLAFIGLAIGVSILMQINRSVLLR